MILALASVHRLAISGNIPLRMVPEYFSESCRAEVAEFVPKHDRGVADCSQTGRVYSINTPRKTSRLNNWNEPVEEQ